ncbi:hypothetical protein QQ045_021023 [Rhodiola kirilowii]
MEINLAGKENMSTPLNPGAKKTGSSSFSMMGTPKAIFRSLSLIFFGIATLIIYSVVKPQIPLFDIPNASLSTIYFDSPGFNGNFNFVANFTNPNKTIDVKFVLAEVDLYFFDKLIATTSLQPFYQRKGEVQLKSVQLTSSLVLLPQNLAVKLQNQVQSNRIKYRIRGSFKVRDSLGKIHYSYWLYGRCQLEMTGPPYGVLFARSCNTTTR